jgi:SPX domain protein involved in polyphosphate accumulation
MVRFVLFLNSRALPKTKNMRPDRLQSQRFELKYFIPERIASTVRDFVSAYLSLDEHGAVHPDFAYPIHSLYLDSDDLALYWQTINGTKNRYKLRLRFYSDKPDTPVFFEIKRRVNDAILKQRGSVRRDAVEPILAGKFPEPAHLLSDAAQQFVAIQRFSRLMLDLRARPKVHVAYRREAWISPVDNSVRVTMDRDVFADAEPLARLTVDMADPVRVFGARVVLEIKFTGRFPNWFGELVRSFDLQRTSAAKYVDGVTELGENRLRRSSVVLAPMALEQSPTPAFEGESDGLEKSRYE